MPATFGVLTAGFSDILGIPKGEVDRFGRVLREAGLITTGARGVNAPPMTFLDAARLLLAFLVTDHAPDAAEAVRDFGQLVCGTTETNGKGQGFGSGLATPIAEGRRLEDCIAEVLRIYAEDQEAEYFKAACLHFGDVEYLPPSRIRITPTSLNAEVIVPGTVFGFVDEHLAASPPHKALMHKESDPEKLLALMEADPVNKHFELGAKYKRAIRITREIMAGKLERIALLIA